MLEVESCSSYEKILEQDSNPVSVSFKSCVILTKSAKLSRLLFFIYILMDIIIGWFCINPYKLFNFMIVM